jgi:prepilin-type processing-associated H-X9-DG protein
MNFVSRKLWIFGGMSLALGACAAKQVAPVQYSLGLMRTEYRDYAQAKADICHAEPRTVSDELDAVNKLLTDFLSSTEQVKNPRSVDHGRALELLEEAAGSLGKVLDVYQANLSAVSRCGFAQSGAFPDLAKQGTDLVERSRARLAESTQLLAVKEAQRKWLEEAPQREQTARQTWCAKNPEVGSTDLYYARKYADGRAEWLFCDGHVVQSAANEGEPALVPPEGLSARDRRKVKPSRYLEAAQGYPAEEIDKQPTSVAGTVAPANGSAASGN